MAVKGLRGEKCVAGNQRSRTGQGCKGDSLRLFLYNIICYEPLLMLFYLEAVVVVEKGGGGWCGG